MLVILSLVSPLFEYCGELLEQGMHVSVTLSIHQGLCSITLEDCLTEHRCIMSGTTQLADRDDHEEGGEDEEHERKGGKYDSEKHVQEEDEFWEELHELSTNIILLLIFLHVTGIVVSSRLHNENLIAAMIAGKKKA